MITYEDTKRLKYNARDFALMMDNEDIDEVIIEFVEVKNSREKYWREP